MKKDTSLIPNGPYCYGSLIKADDKYPFCRTYESCPYNTFKEFNEVSVLWCDFLEKGGLPDDLTDEDWQKLVEHFGSDDKVFDALPLTLLFDSVKECGENEDYKEETK